MRVKKVNSENAQTAVTAGGDENICAIPSFVFWFMTTARGLLLVSMKIPPFCSWINNIIIALFIVYNKSKIIAIHCSCKIILEASFKRLTRPDWRQS